MLSPTRRGDADLSRVRIAITVEDKMLAEIDRLVRGRVFLHRSQAFEMTCYFRISTAALTALGRGRPSARGRDDRTPFDMQR
jgi:hypothetical protein